MSQSDSTGPGGGAGKVNVQDISFTKFIDKSSPKLYEKLANGANIPSLELLIIDASYSGKEPYLIYTLTNVLVSSVSTGGSGGEDRLTENISLNFAAIKVSYQAFDDKKKSGPAIEFTLIPDRVEG
jgi:type VI secretion system secreted protein Hcp